MNLKNYRKRLSCRSCGDVGLENVLSLGKQAIVGFGEQRPTEVPLELCRCPSCSLVQLRHTTNPDLLWNENYGYRSGVNETMCRELKDIVSEIQRTINVRPEDIVLDIGCNDGTLLASYSRGFRVGFDPSLGTVLNASNGLMDACYENLKVFGSDFKIFNTFFHKKPFVENFGDKKAKVVTAISMFYDLDDPNAFLQDVNFCLSPDGIFVIQQNYLVKMLENNAFDNIVHEHLEYYSLTSLKSLLERNGFEVFDVSENEINGGSFRTYIKRKGDISNRFGGSERVREMLAQERELQSGGIYEDFFYRVQEMCLKTKEFIKGVVRKGKRVYVCGASTRGNTFLQVAGIDSKLVVAAAERNPKKWGKVMGKTGIPIVPEEEARGKADYFLVLPWHFREEIVKREQEFLTKGGKMIFGLPEFEII